MQLLLFGKNCINFALRKGKIPLEAAASGDAPRDTHIGSRLEIGLPVLPEGCLGNIPRRANDTLDICHLPENGKLSEAR